MESAKNNSRSFVDSRIKVAVCYLDFGHVSNEGSDHQTSSEMGIEPSGTHIKALSPARIKMQPD